MDFFSFFWGWGGAKWLPSKIKARKLQVLNTVFKSIVG